MISETVLNITKQNALLFDLDGVIFDTEHFYTEFWSEEGRKYCPEIENFAMKIKGHGLNDIMNEYFHSQEIQAMIHADIKIMEKKMTFPYIAGVEDFLKTCKAKNIARCLVTSSKIEKMERVFHQRPEIKDYFANMVTSDDIKRSKPAPDCFLKAAEILNVESKNCIVFEDSLAGIEAAKRANMRVIALSTTYSADVLKKEVDTIIEDFTELALQTY